MGGSPHAVRKPTRTRRGVGPEVVPAPTGHDMPKKGGKGKKTKKR
jgi:hypothetical protein